MSLSFHNLSHSYGQTQVLQDISFTASSGEILCLLGPSGGGKSTLLRLAAGLESLQHGHIELNGQQLAAPGAEPPPEDRPIGLVFQDHVLFPHLTVAQNLGFGLAKEPRQQVNQRVAELLINMDLAGLGERYPHELSGGQQQRVALARALAPRPAVLLLDEPFASVDSTLRRALRKTTRNALKAAGTTAIVVTHDPEEAMQLADSIAIMAGGGIAQHAQPAEIWQQPATLDVALLFGDAQSIDGVSDGAHANCGFNALPTDCPAGPVTVAIRPQGVTLDVAQGPLGGTPVRVEDVRLLGHDWQLQLITKTDTPEHLMATVAALNGIEPGATLYATLKPEDCFVFTTTSPKK